SQYCSFFFSSRRRHTRFSRDWSSDVCSSDLGLTDALVATARDLPAVPLHVEELELEGGAAEVGDEDQHDGRSSDASGAPSHDPEIGRASCRERVWSSVGTVAVEKEHGTARHE